MRPCPRAGLKEDRGCDCRVSSGGLCPARGPGAPCAQSHPKTEGRPGSSWVHEHSSNGGSGYLRVGAIFELNCRLKLFGVRVWKLLYDAVWMSFSASGDD